MLQTNGFLSLLHRYQLLPQIWCAKVIDEAIAQFSTLLNLVMNYVCKNFCS
ncbi:hypothetical protein [Fischerella sp. PCC 9605]|uniref:hypothetical protein n=1 Tax=Fischerella sp. PCC 9605 TaxID=1173024 RepID=UPI001E3772E9|nr:hypothetical protein [Fischerella sp. PCC 9605]